MVVALGVAAGLIGPLSPAGPPPSDTAAAWVVTDSQSANGVTTPAPWPSAVRALRLQTTWSALPLVAALVVLLRVIAALLPPATLGAAPVAGPGLRGRLKLFAYLN